MKLNVYKLVTMDSILTTKLKNVKLVLNNVEPVMNMENVKLVLQQLYYTTTNVISNAQEELTCMELMNV